MLAAEWLKVKGGEVDISEHVCCGGGWKWGGQVDISDHVGCRAGRKLEGGTGRYFYPCWLQSGEEVGGGDR